MGEPVRARPIWVQSSPMTKLEMLEHPEWVLAERGEYCLEVDHGLLISLDELLQQPVKRVLESTVVKWLISEVPIERPLPKVLRMLQNSHEVVVHPLGRPETLVVRVREALHNGPFPGAIWTHSMCGEHDDLIPTVPGHGCVHREAHGQITGEFAELYPWVGHPIHHDVGMRLKPDGQVGENFLAHTTQLSIK